MFRNEKMLTGLRSRTAAGALSGSLLLGTLTACEEGPPELACQVVPMKKEVNPKVVAINGALIDEVLLQIADNDPQAVEANHPVEYPKGSLGHEPIEMDVSGHFISETGATQSLNAHCEGKTPPA